MVRSMVKSWLVRAVQSEVEAQVRAATEPMGDRLGRLELRASELVEENEKLKKKLSMATGAVQACTADLQKVRAAAEQGANVSQQAMQRATSALSAAEAAAEGVTALELRAAEALSSPRETAAPRKPRKRAGT